MKRNDMIYCFLYIYKKRYMKSLILSETKTEKKSSRIRRSSIDKKDDKQTNK